MTEFNEIARIKISSSSYIVLSTVVDSKGKLAGYSIGKFIESKTYTGFGKSILIPTDKLLEFLALFPMENLEEAIRMKGGQL